MPAKYSNLTQIDMLQISEETSRVSVENEALCFFTDIKCNHSLWKSENAKSKIKKDILQVAGVTDEVEIKKLIDTDNEIEVLSKKISDLPILKKHYDVKQSVDVLLDISNTKKAQYKTDIEELIILRDALHSTYRYLNEDDGIYGGLDYKHVVKNMKGCPSPTAQIIGGIMMAICIAFSAAVIVCAPAMGAILVGAGVIGGVIGLGVFAKGRGHGVAKAMYDVSNAYAEHDPSAFQI